MEFGASVFKLKTSSNVKENAAVQVADGILKSNMHFFGAEGEAVEGHDIYERYSQSLDR